MALLLIGAGLGLPGSAQAATVFGQCRGASTSVRSMSATRARLVTLCVVNAERSQAGQALLHIRGALARPAQQHTRAMVSHHILTHGNLARRLRSYTAGHASRIGENVGTLDRSRPTVRAIVLAWMRSPAHRRNILQPAFRDIGIGVVREATNGQRGATFTTSFGWRR